MSTPMTLTTLASHLIPRTRLVHPPSQTHAMDRSLTAPIAALQLHPTLEATLHILNADLPSAHFLVRHMQAPPAVEGMLLHAILHRCEGDMGNARAWSGDVGDACEGWVPKKNGTERLAEEVAQDCKRKDEGRSLVEFVYGPGDSMEKLIVNVENARGKKGGDAETDVEQARIEDHIRKELERVLEWCKEKFGEGSWMDASQAWVRHSEEVRQQAENMVSGDQGWRKF